MDSLKEHLENYLSLLGLEYSEIIENQENDTVRLSIESPTPQKLIGKEGKNLFALQHIFRLILRNISEEEIITKNIILDINDYRKKQEENVQFIARQKIKILEKKGETIYFPPMPSYKRRAIHMYISENFPNIYTESIGEGIQRKLSISFKEQSNKTE